MSYTFVLDLSPPPPPHTPPLFSPFFFLFVIIIPNSIEHTDIGDLNTIAGTEGFAPLCYNAIKGHKLGLRSLLNDDVIPENMTG